MKTLLIALCAMMLSLGCVSATVDESSACDSEAVSFAIPSTSFSGVRGGATFTTPAITSPPVSFDFSSTLDKIGDAVDGLNVAVNSLVIDNSSGQLSWVSGITIDIQGTTPNTPWTTLATYSANGGVGSSIVVQVSMDTSTLLLYLESGAVSLTITLEPSTVDSATADMLAGVGSVSASVSMCLDVSGSKSVGL